MKTNHPHTPERWTCQYGAVYADDGVTRILLADRDEPGTRPVERDSNLRRAAECVNACTNIPDPDTAHAKVRDAMREAHHMLGAALELAQTEELSIVLAHRLAQLSEAHEALNGGPL